MENNGTPPRRPNPRRRRRSKFEKFMHSYFYVIVVALVVILVTVLIIVLVNGSNKRKEEDRRASIEASQSEEAERLRQEAEAQALINQAEVLAAGYDYDGAIAILDSFADNENYFENQALLDKRAAYVQAKESMVAWDDPGKIVHLSTHMLIHESGRAFSNKEYGSTFKYNNITTTEFANILDSLYENNYILVGMDDIVEAVPGENGAVTLKAKTLYLPEGKIPFMLTETYNSPSYIYDNDGNGTRDYASGFAHKMLIDPETGKLTSEITNQQDKVVNGDFNLVLILENFIQEHPDFSYKGARATLAITGKNAIFGYYTNPKYKEALGEADYNKEVESAKELAEELKALGYTFACYTYGNRSYGKMPIAEIQEDLDAWKKEVEPILGPVDTLVFAMNSDIVGSDEEYTGGKYEALAAAGFRYFMGFCGETSSTPWAQLSGNYFRQGRVIINGNSLISNPDLYKGIFDAVAVKDGKR